MQKIAIPRMKNANLRIGVVLLTMNCCKEVVDAHRAGALTLATSARSAWREIVFVIPNRRFCGEESLLITYFGVPPSTGATGIPRCARNDRQKKSVFLGHRAGQIHGREQHKDVSLKQ